MADAPGHDRDRCLIVFAAPFSLIDPVRFYTTLIKPSLIALWVSQLIVFAVYPRFAGKHWERALPAWTLSLGRAHSRSTDSGLPSSRLPAEMSSPRPRGPQAARDVPVSRATAVPAGPPRVAPPSASPGPRRVRLQALVGSCRRSSSSSMCGPRRRAGSPMKPGAGCCHKRRNGPASMSPAHAPSCSSAATAHAPRVRQRGRVLQRVWRDQRHWWSA